MILSMHHIEQFLLCIYNIMQGDVIDIYYFEVDCERARLHTNLQEDHKKTQSWWATNVTTKKIPQSNARKKVHTPIKPI